MLRLISRLFIRIAGWQYESAIPTEELRRCVVIAAPHTSNWDLPFSLAFFSIARIKMRYAIKKEWMFFPMGPLLRWLGAIPIDRSPKKAGENRQSMVEAMTTLFKDNQELALMIPPEGTRKLVPEWKTGFYYTALASGVPIACGFLDYGRKRGGFKGMIHPTGDFDKDMKAIMQLYVGVTGKYPEKFTLDKRYS